MEQELTPPAARPARGRPREADRSPAILLATVDLLRSLGYDRLRVQDVADRAGAGLATIYRRWPTKQALVLDAIGSDLRARAVPDTGDPRADLVTMLRRMVDDFDHSSGDCLVSGFLSALRDDPAVADAFRTNVLADLTARTRDLVAAVLGDDHPELDLRTDLGPALLFLRVYLRGEQVDPEHLADIILAPGEMVPQRSRSKASKKTKPRR